jgi:hypothetical protein
MATVFQGVKKQLIPQGLQFSIPSISPLYAVLIGQIILIIGIIFLILYKFFVYKIRIIEVEDRGKGYKSRLLHAREIYKSGVKNYKVWGKKVEGKPLLIPATSNDFILPMESAFGISRDLVFLHKDINGDHRPMLINEKSELDVDNQKARAWHSLKVKETLNLYQPRNEIMQKYGNIMLIAFIIFGVLIGAYLFLK